jgi:hypothetical protein
MRDKTGQQYMRNRYYDPQTGQFTQTDPIGLAGGLNAYGFAAGDPVSYSDPSGLTVCFQGTSTEIQRLHAATEQATGSVITLDSRTHCIINVNFTSNPGLVGLRNRLVLLVNRRTQYGVGLHGSLGWKGSGCSNDQSHLCPADNQLEIWESQVGESFDAKYFGCRFGTVEMMDVPYRMGPQIKEDLASIIAHELLGHTWAYEVREDQYSERLAIGSENVYRRAQPGMKQRCES